MKALEDALAGVQRALMLAQDQLGRTVGTSRRNTAARADMAAALTAMHEALDDAFDAYTRFTRR